MPPEFPVNIQKLIIGLENTQSINSHLVTELVSQSKVCPADLKRYESFGHNPGESYGRKLIYDNGRFKILLMSWKSGDFTAIHNHGYTEWGCVYFFGNATHRIYEVENGELRMIDKENFLDGQVAPVCGDLIHIMGNAGKTDFTTLHVYGTTTDGQKALKDALVYFPELDKMVTTTGPAFLNIDNSYIVKEEPFKKINPETFADYIQLVTPFFERNNLLELLNKKQAQIN